jgi:aspartate racemase
MSNTSEGHSLGLIGGLGPGATIHYNQELVKAHSARQSVPRLLILHADLDRVLKHAEHRELARLAEYLSDCVGRLSNAGAEVGAIAPITPHICAPELVRMSPLPLVNIVEEVTREIRVRGLKRVALFETRFTIEMRMFDQLINTEVVTPRPDETDYIHETYLQIVNNPGSAGDWSAGLKALAHTLIARDGVEAIVLAGTELSLLFNEANIDFPHIDCARVHVNAIMRRLFDEPDIKSHRPAESG